MINSAYLVELAQYTLDKITKVVLNNAYTISIFTIKRINVSLIELECLVPFGSVANVTLIELKSSTDFVISSNVVAISIATDRLIRQTILLEEVT